MPIPAPVVLPVDPPGDNDFYGWPDGTRVDDTIIVVYRRLPGHNRRLSGQADEHTSYSMVVRSTDNGRSWSQPFDLREAMDPADRVRGGIIPLSHRYKFGLKKPISNLGYKLHLSAIGTTRDGGAVVIGSHGVFRSDDKGRTWTHFREAFREDRHEGPMVFVGPRIIDHPRYGLLLFAHQMIYKNHAPAEARRRLDVYRSRDGGRSWEDIGVDVPDRCEPGSPNAILYDDAVVLMGRNLKSRRLVQLWYRPGEPVKAKDTNMHGKRSVDTSDLMFNPVTKRFEVVQSDRSNMSVNLFSLSPQDWDTANWRFEARLFKRGGSFYSTADGFHTGGAIVDRENNVQHVFFYSGHAGGPAGVFRLTRTLDTPKLAEFLKSANDPAEKDTVRWTGHGESNRWDDPANWDLGVPDRNDAAVFEDTNSVTPIVIAAVAELGRIEVRLPRKTDRLTLAGDDRGRLVLAAAYWEPGMSLDLSAGHTEGPKVFEFACEQRPQGVTFLRLKEHDGDPVEIHGFKPGDFFRFEADPFTSCDQGKPFRVDAVRFVGWPSGGAAAVKRRESYWYLLPAGTEPPTDPGEGRP